MLVPEAVPGCFTPDGSGLVVESRSGLQLIEMKTGSGRSLTFPSPPASDTGPVLSPDGRWLAFVRYQGSSSGLSDIYRIPFPPDPDSSRPPERLTRGNMFTEGVAWTADGAELVFSSTRQGFRILWRTTATRPGTPRRIDASGADAICPTISGDGRRLLYLQDRQDRNVWRFPVPRHGSAIRPDLPGSEGGIPLIASPRWDQMAEYSPDGGRIAFVSHRNGADEIYVCEADGSHPYAVTAQAGPAALWPRWSPDGRTLAFAGRPEGNADIFLAPAQGGPARRLTSHPAQDDLPSWSGDGQWLYFTSDRTGRDEVWKTLADGSREAVRITRNGGRFQRESPDGRHLYFIKPGSGLWWIPITGGDESPVWSSSGGDVRLPDGSNWILYESGFLYAAGSRLHYLPAGRGRLAPAAGPVIPGLLRSAGLSLSPDGRWLLLARQEQSGTTLMLMDHFR